MNRLKELLKDKTFTRGSIFIVFNAALLCILFFIIRDIGSIASTLYGWLRTLLDAFWPLILGLILAYLLNPLSELIDSKLMERLIKLPEDPLKAEKRRNLRHLLSVILTFLIAIAAVIAIILGFAVMIIGNINFSDLPSTFSDFMRGILNYESTFKNWITTNIPESMLSERLTDLTSTVMMDKRQHKRIVCHILFHQHKRQHCRRRGRHHRQHLPDEGQAVFPGALEKVSPPDPSAEAPRCPHRSSQRDQYSLFKIHKRRVA